MDILEIVIRGSILGAIFSLIAIGLNLQYGVTRILNIAHGEFLMVGAYVTWFVFTFFGVNPLVSLAISGPVVFVLGVIVQITVFRRLVHLSTSGEELEFRSLLACFGLMFIIQNVVGITGKWANWPPQIGTPYLYQTINILGERVQLNMIVAAVMSIFITGLMYFLLRSTRVGLAMRATVEEPTGAQLVGINIFKIHAVSFGLGALLSALAGSMLAMMSQNITPYTGPQYTFIALAVIILGGMGSFVGSLLGGFFIGYLYYTCLAIDALTVNIVIYAFLIIMLIIKPKGLFGK